MAKLLSEHLDLVAAVGVEQAVIGATPDTKVWTPIGVTSASSCGEA